MQYSNPELFKVIERYVPDAGKLIDTSIDADTGSAKIHLRAVEAAMVMPELVKAIEVISNFTGKTVYVTFNPSHPHP